MRKYLSAIFFLVFSFLTLADLAESQTSLDSFVGNVQVSHDGGTNWVQAEAETPLSEMDIVRTGPESYCDILLSNDEGDFRVLENTTVVLQSLAKSTRIRISTGKTLFTFDRKLSADEAFEVETHTIVAAIRGTQFLVDESADTSTISVNEGEIEVRHNIDPALLDNRKDLISSMEFRIAGGREYAASLKEKEDFEKELISSKGNIEKIKGILKAHRMNFIQKIRRIENRAFLKKLIEERKKARAERIIRHKIRIKNKRK